MRENGIVRTRIILDTAPVRAYVARDQGADILDVLVRYPIRVSVALADNAASELQVALIDRRIKWWQWKASRSGLKAIVDPKSPIFPDREEVELLRPVVSEFDTDNYTNLNDWMRGTWKNLLRSRSVRDLEKGKVFKDSDGGISRVRSNSREFLVERMEEKRASWIKRITDARDTYRNDMSQETIAENLFEALRLLHPNEQHLELRYNAYVRAIARFVHLSQREKSPYRPEGKKRRGDSFDMDLLLALSRPSIVCTLDKRLREHLKAARSIQTSQVLTPQELVERLEMGVLVDCIPEGIRPIR